MTTESKLEPAAPTDHGTSTANAVAPRSNLEMARRFGRLFPDAPAWTLGSPALDQQAIEAVSNAMHSETGADSKSLPAGMTYLGQFIDHDITFDPTSIGERAVDIDQLVNFRVPALDLDSVYGAGPSGQPYLYVTEPRQGATGPFEAGPFMLTGPVQFVSGAPGNDKPSVKGADGALYDLPRAAVGRGTKRALLGDPRNDENLIVAQLHRTLLHFHNAVVLERPDLTKFKDLRLEVVRHYQWLVLHEFLPAIAGPAAVDAARKERRFYLVGAKPGEQQPFIPLEFSGAAYRYGHSMVRDKYRFNTVFDENTETKRIFTFTGGGGFFGGDRYPTNWLIDWAQFFDGLRDGVTAQRAKAIDAALSHELKIPQGPPKNPNEEPPFRFLASLNLERGARHYGLPSGQEVARRMGLQPLSPELLSTGIAGKAIASQPGLASSTPLWLYILKEAELQHQGEHLGDVGGTIVAEVFVGLLAADPESILSHPAWRPTLGGAGTFGIADLFKVVEKRAGNERASIPEAGVINPLGLD